VNAALVIVALVSLSFGEAQPKAKSAWLEPASLLGRGWTIEPGPFPEGVVAMAAGPSGKSGRPIVVLSVLERSAEIGAPAAQASLAGALKAARPELTFLGVEADGPFVEVRAALDAKSSATGAAFFLLPTRPPMMLTLLAPKPDFEVVARQVRKRLLASTAKP
jgi:hypothetical protein